MVRRPGPEIEAHCDDDREGLNSGGARRARLGAAAMPPFPSPGTTTASRRRTGPPETSSPSCPASLRLANASPSPGNARSILANAARATRVFGLGRCSTHDRASTSAQKQQLPRLRVLLYLANLDADRRDRGGGSISNRSFAARAASSVSKMIIEAPPFSPSLPMTADEPRHLGEARDAFLPQELPCLVEVLNRAPADHRVHTRASLVVGGVALQDRSGPCHVRGRSAS